NETGTVTITADPNNGAAGPELDLGGGAGTPIDLVFNSGNYSTPQTVTVTSTAEDEDPGTGNRAATITHTTDSSADGDYEGAVVDSVAVTVLEDDCGFWSYSQMDFNKDCYVDLVDLAEFLSEWLACTQPFETGCVNQN
ncbi:MAG: hypothetical protein JXD22_01350, partial [Sedimentisphaerales bacterium]|nr:hypothetical protein [Sedimentisphaerales bacterium]